MFKTISGKNVISGEITEENTGRFKNFSCENFFNENFQRNTYKWKFSKASFLVHLVITFDQYCIRLHRRYLFIVFGMWRDLLKYSKPFKGALGGNPARTQIAKKILSGSDVSRISNQM